jgi:hypothetical protein
MVFRPQQLMSCSDIPSSSSSFSVCPLFRLLSLSFLLLILFDSCAFVHPSPDRLLVLFPSTSATRFRLPRQHERQSHAAHQDEESHAEFQTICSATLLVEHDDDNNNRRGQEWNVQTYKLYKRPQKHESETNLAPTHTAAF